MRPPDRGRFPGDRRRPDIAAGLTRSRQRLGFWRTSARRWKVLTAAVAYGVIEDITSGAFAPANWRTDVTAGSTRSRGASDARRFRFRPRRKVGWSWTPPPYPICTRSSSGAPETRYPKPRMNFASSDILSPRTAATGCNEPQKRHECRRSVEVLQVVATRRSYPFLPVPYPPSPELTTPAPRHCPPPPAGVSTGEYQLLVGRAKMQQEAGLERPRSRVSTCPVCQVGERGGDDRKVTPYHVVPRSRDLRR